jgi:CRISPR system Cascade subunit CasE
MREVDEGYLAHVVLRELWQERAPAPFVMRGRGRHLEIWGYGTSNDRSLVQHATEFGDPQLLRVIGDLGSVASKEMPLFAAGRQLGFVVRACPIVRLARAVNGHRPGAEVDAFLARCFAAGQGAAVSREAVYREWLVRNVSRPDSTGVRVLRVGIVGMTRERVIRRTHQPTRSVRRLERPDVRFEGELVVEDGERLLRYLGHGVGRHRAFGFGALMLTPQGRGTSLAQDSC